MNSQALKPKGRSSKLISQRNYRLAVRFYFYNVLIGLHADRCLLLLEEEFDISKATIYDNILKANHIIETLKAKRIKVKQLEAWYPYLNWSARFSTQSPTFEQWFLDQF